MRKRALSNMFAGIIVSFTMFFTSCVPDTNLTPLPVTTTSFTEEFDTIQSAWDRGWRFLNHSAPIGRLWVDYTATAPTYPHTDDVLFHPDWKNGNDNYSFGAYSSKSTRSGYLCNSWAANGNFPVPSGFASQYQAEFWINNWAVSPPHMMKNGDKIVFYTRCDTTARLQVRLNKTNTDFKNVGYTLEESGDFGSLLLDINPNYYAPRTTSVNSLYAFPDGNWTRFEATVYGLDKPTMGRFAFRSMLPGTKGNIWGAPDANPTTSLTDVLARLNLSILGIDKVQYISSN
jgi:hypothetical protein